MCVRARVCLCVWGGRVYVCVCVCVCACVRACVRAYVRACEDRSMDRYKYSFGKIARLLDYPGKKK